VEIEQATGQRRCSECHEEKHLEDYHRDKHGRLGRAYACKVCVRRRKAAQMAARRAADPEKYREISRRFSQKPEAKERRRAVYAADPEPIRAQNARGRTRRAAAEGTFTTDEWLALLEMYGHRCLACGSDGPLEPDHIIPLTWGGTNWITNIQPLCRKCNGSKGNRHATDYRLTALAG
jgi:5-methylcytosine-specific restriction endonuclease McrA